MKVCDTNHVTDFCDLCLQLSPRASFGESRSNGIWALSDVLYCISMLLHCDVFIGHCILQVFRQFILSWRLPAKQS